MESSALRRQEPGVHPDWRCFVCCHALAGTVDECVEQTVGWIREWVHDGYAGKGETGVQVLGEENTTASLCCCCQYNGIPNRNLAHYRQAHRTIEGRWSRWRNDVLVKKALDELTRSIRANPDLAYEHTKEFPYDLRRKNDRAWRELAHEIHGFFSALRSVASHGVDEHIGINGCGHSSSSS